jgi:PAS domain S-box-containing protein
MKGQTLHLARLWPNLAVRTKGAVLLAPPTAALILSAIVFPVFDHYALSSERKVTESLKATSVIQQIDRETAIVNDSIRGYFWTGDPTFLDRLRGAAEAFHATSRQLEGLTQQQPAERERLEALRTAVDAEVGRAWRQVTRYAAGGLSPAGVRDYLNGADRRFQAGPAKIIAAMLGTERELSSRNSAVRERIRQYVNLLVYSALGLGILGGIAGTWLFAAGIGDRIERLGRAVENIPESLEWVSATTEQDEIGQLARGLAKAAALLHDKSTALEHAVDGVARVGADGRLQFANESFTRLTGRDNPAPLGAVWRDLIAREDLAALEECEQSMSLSGIGRANVSLEQPGGERIPLALTLIRSRQGSAYYVIVSDLSIRQRAERALTEARAAAEASSAAKTEFLARMSHEIRTPLNIIVGLTELLVRGEANSASMLPMLERNCAALLSLVNNVLDISKIEAGRLSADHTVFRVRDVVRQVSERFAAAAVAKGLSLSTRVDRDVPEGLASDPFRIEQIVANFLSNAVKFTVDGGIELRVQRVERNGAGFLRFSVRDHGPGIPRDLQELIFQPFAQADTSVTRKFGGTGLGLTICRDLAGILGGAVEVESELGRGSTFSLIVPAVAGGAGEPQRASSDGAAVHPPVAGKILVADDSADNATLLRLYLAGEPLEVDWVEDGLAAVERVTQGAYDLVLMDLEMPRLDGYNATRRIREWERDNGRAPVPVVALSAHAFQELIRRSLDAGCTEHLSKPVKRSLLLDTIRRLLAKRASRSSDAIDVPPEILPLVPAYLASKATEADEAERCLEQREFSRLQRFGHNLKGSAAGYGFPGLSQLGAALEAASRNQDPILAGGALRDISECIQDAATAMNKPAHPPIENALQPAGH